LKKLYIAVLEPTKAKHGVYVQYAKCVFKYIVRYVEPGPQPDMG